MYSFGVCLYVNFSCATIWESRADPELSQEEMQKLATFILVLFYRKEQLISRKVMLQVKGGMNLSNNSNGRS